MTREFLKQLGIEDKTVIDSIMDENGRDINSEKAKFGDYETLKTQLSDANKKIEEFGKLDFDGVKAMADDWLYPGQFQFGTQFLICNNVSMSVSSAGLFFSASANTIDEDEVGYTSEVNRQLKKKLEFDKINGNVAITGKGLYLFENGYKKKTPEEQKKAKYGFKVEKGVTEYDGALVSNVIPKSATWNTDKTEAIVDYGGKKYKYKVVKDAKGNVTSFTKEEVKEETK